MFEGCDEEAEELLRHALKAAPLSEGGKDGNSELVVFYTLLKLLVKTTPIDQLDELILRYREVAKEESQIKGSFGYSELDSLYYTARLHEVQRTCTPCWKPLPPERRRTNSLNLVLSSKLTELYTTRSFSTRE